MAYQAIDNIRHNGNNYSVGDGVENLTATQALQLINLGVLIEVNDEATDFKNINKPTDDFGIAPEADTARTTELASGADADNAKNTDRVASDTAKNEAASVIELQLDAQASPMLSAAKTK